MSMAETRCGFVAVLGLPNAGKSTLVNQLVGAKVSIVSHKVQTTRCRILGIALQGQSQMVLMDTPGVFQPQKSMERAMVDAAFDALAQADIALHLVDVSQKSALHDADIILKKLPETKPCVLALNKVDKIDKPKLLALAAALNEKFPYAETFMISALKANGTDKLAEKLALMLPEGLWHFEEDQISDMPLRFMAAEITREQVFRQLHQELPYAALVETEAWEEFDNGDVKINQAIYVRRDSQKAIVLGKGGQQIKKIGEAARLELEKLMERKVHLKLHVKVQENWPDRPESLRIMGL